MAKKIIECRDLYKEYNLYGGELSKLKALFYPKTKSQKKFIALNHIDLDFEEGQITGLIGLNGSGKSTLSSIISGVSFKTSGSLKVEGEVRMLSAYAGLQPYLSGLENIEYKCLLLGFSKKEIKAMKDEIIDFADIGIYIDQPTKTYSYGMLARLGFAISVCMDPDILVIDEALAVGDNAFMDKCIAKMNSFKQQGKCIIFVSHSIGLIQTFCKRVVWLHKGNVVGDGDSTQICRSYDNFISAYKIMNPQEREIIVPTVEDYK